VSVKGLASWLGVLHDLGIGPRNLPATCLFIDFRGGISAHEFLLSRGAPNTLADEVSEGIFPAPAYSRGSRRTSPPRLDGGASGSFRFPVPIYIFIYLLIYLFIYFIYLQRWQKKHTWPMFYYFCSAPMRPKVSRLVAVGRAR